MHTLGLPVAGKLTHVFKGADLDAQLAVLARGVASKLPGGTLAAAREVSSPRCLLCQPTAWSTHRGAEALLLDAPQ